MVIIVIDVFLNGVGMFVVVKCLCKVVNKISIREKLIVVLKLYIVDCKNEWFFLIFSRVIFNMV